MTRYVSFLHNGDAGAGVFDHDQVHPLRGATSLSEVLAWSAEQRSEAVATALRTAPLEEVRLTAPLPDPMRNPFCVGWNYIAHFEEGRHARPEVTLPTKPTLFSKATRTVAGPYDTIPSHSSLTSQLDWEVEVAVVIGRKGRDIAEEDALSHVFGYTVANDVSARNMQADYGGQWLKGKSLDGTCPMGPALVTADEIDDPQRLAISCRVNGETVQVADTSMMIFPVARIIAELSAGLTLLPGDIVLTGTPEGVGHQRRPPQYLQAGDLLESEVEGLGVMRNQVR